MVSQLCVCGVLGVDYLVSVVVRGRARKAEA